MNEKAYEEIGPNYRFFLAWRHAALAGGLVILWGTCSLLITAFEKGLSIAWLIPVLASLSLFCLWFADHRTRQIYRSLTEAGKALEGSDPGPYHALTGIGIPKDAPWFPKKDRPLCKLFSQSFALDCFFVGSAVVLLVVAIFLLISPPDVPNPTQATPNQEVQATR
jgi:Na+/H+ antiporter NhaD/arsenite permease-like protein